MKTGYGEGISNEDGVYCFRCGVALVSDKARMRYLMSAFPTQVLKCPICGLIHIDENTVMTKALEVERTLEEK